MSVLWSITLGVGTLLQLLVILSLSRGLARKYPVLAVYSVVSFLITVAESAAFLKLFTWKGSFSVMIYWIDEMIIQVLVFTLVVSLTSKALKRGPGHRSVGLSLALVSALVMAIAVLLAYNPRTADISQWMTDASRNLSFASAIFNMLLWSVLLSQREKDAQLLMVSGGIGIQTTGKAIAHSIRSLGFWNGGNMVMVFTYLFSLLILWMALRRKQETASPEAVTSPL